MNNLVNSVSQHGYLLIFLVALGEALGLPLPAALAFVAAGAAAAAHILSVPTIFVDAVAAIMIGDTLLFFLGRYTGWALLAGLCRLSLNPETCILRSAESFYKRGRLTLLFAKFIPGINTMAPPLAGSMKMRPFLFLRFDLAGASLYAIVYIAVGFLFRDFLASLAQGFQTAGRAVESVTVIALIVYAGYRVWLYRKHAVYRVVPRVQVEELARRLASEDNSKVLLMDVRSHGYYDSG